MLTRSRLSLSQPICKNRGTLFRGRFLGLSSLASSWVALLSLPVMEAQQLVLAACVEG